MVMFFLLFFVVEEKPEIPKQPEQPEQVNVSENISQPETLEQPEQPPTVNETAEQPIIEQPKSIEENIIEKPEQPATTEQTTEQEEFIKDERFFIKGNFIFFKAATLFIWELISSFDFPRHLFFPSGIREHLKNYPLLDRIQ